MTASTAVTQRYLRALRTGDLERADAEDIRARRLIVVVVTVATGAGVSAWALRIPAGDAMFYPATAILAAVWMAGAFASGPVHVGCEPYVPGRRPLWTSVGFAAALVGIFCVGAVVVAQIPALRDPVVALLEHGTRGNLAAVAALTAVNGIAEECFHRGAVYSATQRARPIITTTIIYAAVTATTGIPLLVLAAVILGAVTAVQRRCTGGVLGPCVTHVAWSLVMLIALGPLLDAASTL